MPLFTDQTGRNIELADKPVRIISLVPSQTELLYDLGLESQVVGITAYCVHPPHWLKEKKVIGGTKNLNINLIKELQPDLIIGNKEENIEAQVEDLARDFNVWISDVKDVNSALEMIESVGELTGTGNKAHEITKQVHTELAQLHNLQPDYKTACFIWKDPYMVVSDDTYIQGMLNLAGLTNVNVSNSGRYPEITLAELVEYQPDVLLLSSEPYAFNAGDLHSIAEQFPNSVCKIIDGEMISWYGSRLIKGVSYLKKIRSEIDQRLNILF